MRIGWNLPVEFSDPRLTLSAHSQKLYNEDRGNKRDWSLYAMFGIRGSAILHDITLDGSLFRNYDTGVNKEYFVGEYYAGFGLRRDRYEFGYVHTYRTKQYKTQNDSQYFGSLALRVGF